MKPFLKEFFLRGLIAAGFGPLVLAVIYAVLGGTGQVSSLTPREVSLGIVSISVLAFLAGGMTAIYLLEQLPLMTAILLHGAGLYTAYILVYLLNGWLKRQLVPMLLFTAVFLAGYAVIWLLIYTCTRRRTEWINGQLHKLP